MSMTKCRECGNEISTKANACPKCGARAKRTSFTTRVVLFVIVLGGAIVAYESEKTKSDAVTKEANRVAGRTAEQKTTETREAAAKAAADALREKQRAGLAWSYEEQTDPLDGRKIKWALISSANEINFGFPYQGSQRGVLQLRVSPKEGT